MPWQVHLWRCDPLNKLREELQSILDETDSNRPAVIRRCKRIDYLYATDLPLTADQNNVTFFTRRAEKRGWRSEIQAGWILLDRLPAGPPENGFRGPYGPEAKCCASILRRHPEKQKKSGNREKRMLIKAGEENRESYERVCTILHREWAAVLRQGDALPDLPVTFFEEDENP